MKQAMLNLYRLEYEKYFKYFFEKQAQTDFIFYPYILVIRQNVLSYMEEKVDFTLVNREYPTQLEDFFVLRDNSLKPKNLYTSTVVD